MGFSKGKLGAPLEGNVVIGFLDTGLCFEIYLPHWLKLKTMYFTYKLSCLCIDDEGMSAPPAKWKGKCIGANFTCNKDSEGHGTHTSSTAAGREVQGASYFGLAEGAARGGVPNARIAMYKVCWSYGCSSADILAAYDDAIADGVDIISVSLGSDFPFPYMEDPIAIGSFHAMKNGILTSNSAGNSGTYPYSVSNYAPWTLTVAASTMDRKYAAQVVLGNGLVLSGLSINNFDLNGTTYPLIWGGDAVNFSADSFYSVDFAFSFPVPATVISNEDRVKVLNYIRTTENPTATILVAHGWKDVVAASVVSFSSRGPNPITPDILKPDITAPGVDILAAWSPVAPPLSTTRTPGA
ncbi:hypothetical protein NC652_008978 [Populus alba x Populus x berolinensis]|nr:hypothetical protein NC652_008978 [Populus alba x Populus x berolinensis]